ncbi:hypothetical protein [Cellulomonas gilvus]|uniref:hypothetical protein n=1 Tax=Cellulomonas gilvus TaxID=11 RepID=UPI0002FE2CCC|nr:hypothetical protein [Cellulomonas gilvus]
MTGTPRRARAHLALGVAVTCALVACAPHDDVPRESRRGSAPTAGAPALLPDGSPALTTATFLDSIRARMADDVRFRVAQSKSVAEGTDVLQAEVVSVDGTAATSVHHTPPDGVTYDQIVVDGTMYVRIEGENDDRYVVLDLARAAAEHPEVPAPDAPTALLDPFGWAEGALLDVEYVGMDTIGRQDVAHYRLRLETDALLADLAEDPDGPAPTRSAGEPPTVTVTCWLDVTGLPIRSTLSFEGRRSTTTWSGWQDPSIEITPPPADQLSDVDPFVDAAGV